ncbi:MAG: ASCH domain-containing protein [Anaerolineales bacterium]|nr:ASCH domain-containing protein [Anaerolineales bacterium]
MQNEDKITAYWQAYLETLPKELDKAALTYTAWAFGSGAELADELGALVVQGTKTATLSVIWEYEAEGEALPQIGELNIILDGKGTPICIIETTEIEVKPFNQVDAQFAYDEGEGDRSFAYWRDAHWGYYQRELAKIGKAPHPEMEVVCERFRVVYKSPSA